MHGGPNEVSHDLLPRYQFYVASLTVLTVRDSSDDRVRLCGFRADAMRRSGFRKICTALVNDRSSGDECKLQNRVYGAILGTMVWGGAFRRIVGRGGCSLSPLAVGRLRVFFLEFIPDVISCVDPETKPVSVMVCMQGGNI